MGRRPKSGRLRPKVCHRTAVTYTRGGAVTVNRRDLNPVYSLSLGHLDHANRSEARITPKSASSSFPTEHRAICAPRRGLPGFGELPPNEECAGVRGDEDHEFAWSGGPSFLAALDIAGHALPVRHTQPGKESRIRRYLRLGFRHRGQLPGIPPGVAANWHRRGGFQFGGEKDRYLFNGASARLGRQKRAFLNTSHNTPLSALRRC